MITNRPVVPDRVAWLLTEMLKTPSRTATAPATFAADRSDANICEQCDNFTTSTEFLPQLQARLADSIELRDDAEARGSHSEVAHARVSASLQRHLTRLAETTPTTTQA